MHRIPLFLAFLVFANTAIAQKILFIRGGVGTVGFFEGGSDEQGADVFNYSTSGGNHGWGELGAALVAEGFSIEQLAENPVSGGVPTPIPLNTMNLSQYAVIVFGSNNAEYSTAQVDAFMAYIDAGGAGLFISDANFGQNWGDAPSSDQHFLERFGLTMNQDQGTYTIRDSSEFVVPEHPILEGVDDFDGEGVSPITRDTPPDGVDSSVVTLARNSLRRNTGANQGPSRSVTSRDASLVVATVGSGRIAGHYDRNTFFNTNGAGTNINRLDNEKYARNLFNWLAGNPVGSNNYAPRGYFRDLLPGSTLTEGAGFSTRVVAKDPDGTVASVGLKVDGVLIATDSTSPFDLPVPGLPPGSHTITAIVTDGQGATTDVAMELVVLGDGDIEKPLDRGNWVLSGSNNTGSLGNAIDGNIGSRWATQQTQRSGQKFGIDFGHRRLFQRIVLQTPNNPDDYPRGYIVRGSDTGADFTVLAAGSGDDATTDILLPAPVTYRYVEIEQTGTSNVNWWSIHEINILQPPTRAALPLASWLQLHYRDALPSLSDDSDSDQLTTLQEYAFHSNPFADSSGALPTATSGIDPDDQQRFIDYTFRRWIDLAGSDVEYVVEASTDLQAWVSSGFGLQSIGSPLSNGDGTETVTWRIKPEAPGRRHFVRLKLIQK